MNCTNKTQNKIPQTQQTPTNIQEGRKEEEGRLEAPTTRASKPGPRSSKIRMVECKEVRINLTREAGTLEPSKSVSQTSNLVTDEMGRDDYYPEHEEEPLPKKRKQGRSTTTGDYERLKARKAVERERREAEEEREMLDPSTPLTGSRAWKRMQDRVAGYLEEMREAPLVDITAQTLDRATVLKKIVVRFKNMQGTVKKEIAEAACLMQAALHTLAIRALVSSPTTDLENGETEAESLRREIRQLREDNLRLQGELKAQKEMGRMKVPRVLPRKEISAGKGRKEKGETARPPTEDTDMEIEVTSDNPPAPEPILRPPIKGVQKRLELVYPSGVDSEENRKVYDSITAGIERLLQKRSRLAYQGSQPTSSQEAAIPRKDPQSAAAPASAGVVVPARSKKGKKDAAGGKTVPSKAPEPGKKGKTGPAKTAKGQTKASSDPTPLTLPPPLKSRETSWAKVVGRKERKKGEAATKSQPDNPLPTKNSGPEKASPPQKLRAKGKAQQTTGPRPRARKAPRTAAVTITCPEGQYAETISLARQKINLSELGITNVRARKAATGALVYEIPGEGKKEKADLFANKLMEVLREKKGVRVARPSKKGELRVRGLDESATKEEVVAEVARIGGCYASEIKTGEIRTLPKMMGTLWVRCPLQAANKVATAGRITVGWVTARVEALKPRPLQCYKCLERGHVREKCTSAIDRKGSCYNCGAPGHKANECTAKTRCPLCAEAGLPANHRVGGTDCHPKRKGKPKNGGKSTNPSQKVAAAEEEEDGPPSKSRSDTASDRKEGELPKPQRKPRSKEAPRGKKEKGTNEVPVADLIQLEEVIMEEV